MSYLIKSCILVLVYWLLFLFTCWIFTKIGITGDVEARAFLVVVFAALANITARA